jgi:uncharacterized integral membrane protein
MRPIRTLLTIALLLLFILFAAANWTPVTVKLWPPYELVVKLPVLVLVAAFAGWLPAGVAHAVARWRWRRRLERTERELEAARPAPAAEPAAPAAPAYEPEPPQAQPMVVPPAGA